MRSVNECSIFVQENMVLKKYTWSRNGMLQ